MQWHMLHNGFLHQELAEKLECMNMKEDTMMSSLQCLQQECDTTQLQVTVSHTLISPLSSITGS